MKSNKIFEARIYWLTEAQGGRRDIPYSNKYAPIIKITKPQVKSNDFWSVFVFNKLKINNNETISNIQYLSVFAPDNLYEDVEFLLYEGQKNIARGVVLREIE